MYFIFTVFLIYWIIKMKNVKLSNKELMLIGAIVVMGYIGMDALNHTDQIIKGYQDGMK